MLVLIYQIFLMFLRSEPILIIDLFLSSRSVPVVGKVVGPAFESFLEKQKYKLRHPGDKARILFTDSYY